MLALVLVLLTGILARQQTSRVHEERSALNNVFVKCLIYTLKIPMASIFEAEKKKKTLSIRDRVLLSLCCKGF